MRRPAFLGQLHPHSIKYLSSGHPWIIKDQYTDQFPPHERFIIAQNRGKPFALCLHDPRHRRIKARLWSKQGQFEKQIENFDRDLCFRIKSAIEKRKKSQVQSKRENFYVIFGEGDQLPGLFVQMLGGEVLIQYYSFFWEKYQKLLLEEIVFQLKEQLNLSVESSSVWIQIRSDGSFPQEGPKCLDPNQSMKKFTLSEFGVKYQILLGHRYDIGIYTDMSSIRSLMKDLIQPQSRVLNLFSYTGAFSLYALKLGASCVTSVDLSEKYLEWLNENIQLNQDLSASKHEALAMKTSDYLKKAKLENKKFDFIVCDPPSFSSDGTKQNNSLKFFEDHMQDLFDLLSPKGQLMVFINTHSITRSKFKQSLTKLLPQGLVVKQELGLAEDCPRISGFPEGDYLKGLLLERL